MKRAILSAIMFAAVAFGGPSSGYIGLNTAVPMFGTQAIQGSSGDVAMSVSQPLQYSTEPVMQQLRTEPITSNFGQLDAFPSAAVLQQQSLLYNAAIMGEPKPVPLSFTQPMIDAAMLSQQLPYQQAIATPAAFPQGKTVKPVKEFKYVNAPITNQFETLPVKELPNIIQHYAVPSTFTTQENIKQPITQPVWQPYLQRYEQRAVPVVQPIVNRVVQPIIHRQLHPFLTSQTIQGQQEQAIVNAPKVLDFNNQPIVGSELDAKPLENRAEVPQLPVMGAASATKK
jgi:hypothetical protein